MQKNLSKDCFSGMIPQNELIELGMTHQFDSIDLDMADMFDGAAMMGKKFACQFLKSASIPVGCFDLPVEIDGDDASFAEVLKKVDTIVDLANEVGAKRCRLRISRSGEVVYHENFEQHKKRIVEIAERLGKSNIFLGLALTAGPDNTSASYQFVKKHEELLTLAKMVGKPNVGVVLDAGAWQTAGCTVEAIRKLQKQNIVDVLLCDPSESANNLQQLPNTDEGSFCVEVLKHLAEIGFDGTVAVTGNASEFESLKSIDVAARLNDVFRELNIKAGLIVVEATENNDSEESATAATTA